MTYTDPRCEVLQTLQGENAHCRFERRYYIDPDSASRYCPKCKKVFDIKLYGSETCKKCGVHLVRRKNWENVCAYGCN